MNTCAVKNCHEPRSKNGSVLCNSHRTLKWRYKLSRNELDALHLMRITKVLCPICHLRPVTVVDHSHTDGHPRAALCHNCNIVVGYVEAKGTEDVEQYLFHDWVKPGNMWKWQMHRYMT